MALPRGFDITSPWVRSELLFFNSGWGKDIVPKAFGMVFGPKDKMKPEKYTDALPGGIGFK